VNAHQIIIKPLITEKTTRLTSEANQYSFEVARDANKIEIGKAVTSLFGVRVTDVRTSVVRGDQRRVGRYFGKTRQWKKAIVTVHPGDTISFYGDE
jgi:large subunit ribosomal protein L23